MPDLIRHLESWKTINLISEFFLEGVKHYICGWQGREKCSQICEQPKESLPLLSNDMKQQESILGLMKYGSLHYEKLSGDKEGTSSVRVNDQYRIEFTETIEEGNTVATICNITELSNHYQ